LLNNLLRRRGDASNTVIGIILLIMLLVFVGPNVIPDLLSRTFPFVDEGVPCQRLRTANNRARHQSLIGRAAQDPLSLRVETSGLPADPSGVLSISVIITNNTIGTVPIVFDETQLIVGDDGSSGVGIVFSPPVPISLGTVRQTAGVASFPEPLIKLLGPRQRCVTTVSIPATQLSGLAAGAQVTAYYRITTAGATQAAAGGTIFTDQGLAIIPNGVVFSPPTLIPAASLTAG
jgi:hypothetical protein